MAATARLDLPPAGEPAARIDRLRRQLCALGASIGLAGDCGAPLALGNPVIDGALGGGLSASALQDIVAGCAIDLRFTRDRQRRARAQRRKRGFCPHAGKKRALDRRGSLARRKRRALWAQPRRSRDCSRAADHGCRRARARRAVGDGGSAALPRRRHGDRRNAFTRHRSGGDAAACARGRRRQRARPHSAHRAGRWAFRRRDALDRRRGALPPFRRW